PIACDGSVSAPLSPAVDNDLLRFSVADGEVVQITVLNGTPAGANFSAQCRLLTATGAPPATSGGFTDTAFAGQERDCGPLPASVSPYQIEVQDQDLTDTGTYAVHFQRLTAAVACESMPVCIIDPAVDNDLIRFTVTDMQTVQITVLNGTPAGA